MKINYKAISKFEIKLLYYNVVMIYPDVEIIHRQTKSIN